MPDLVVPSQGPTVVLPGGGGAAETVVVPAPLPVVVTPAPAGVVVPETTTTVTVPTGAPGPAGPPGAGEEPVSGTWDVGLMNPFAGPLDLGTDGFLSITGTVFGGWFFGNVWGFMGADHNLHTAFAIMMAPGTFPYVPSSPPAGFGYPSNFGYIVSPETSPGAADGWKFTIVPSTTNFGFPGFENLFGLIRGEAQPSGVSSGIEAFWSGQSPVDLTGRALRYNGSIQFKIQE